MASKGNQKNERNTKDLSDWKTEFLNKKIGKLENKFTSKNSFSYLKPTTKREMKHNQKVSLQNLNDKQTKINQKINVHLKKSTFRKEKWDEKAAKKSEKKKS